MGFLTKRENMKFDPLNGVKMDKNGAKKAVFSENRVKQGQNGKNGRFLMVFGAIFPTTEAAENPTYDSSFLGGVGGGILGG